MLRAPVGPPVAWPTPTDRRSVVFDWFRPTCPVTASEKVWVERRMAWLACVFGPERLLKADVVLPTPAFFPDPYDGTDESAARLFGRVCGYLRVEPDRFGL